MNALERVVTILDHKEADRVPFFNFLTIHGAKLLNMSYREYFNKAENVVLGQEKLREIYGHDCFYPYFYAATEVEAFGGTSVENKHGPPQAGRPPFKSCEDVLSKDLPDPNEVFSSTLFATETLAKKYGDKVPIINAIIAPFSLPIMLVGMDKWVEIIVKTPEKAREILEFLTPYRIETANVFFESGATALGYFNPMASPHMVQLHEYKEIAFQCDKNILNKINGPAAFALAGSRAEPLMELIVDSGAAAVVISSHDNLQKVKTKWGSKINLFGNLNNVEMENWTKYTADRRIKNCIDAAASNGGFIISDHHGDLPERVTNDILIQIRDSVEKWGKYS